MAGNTIRDTADRYSPDLTETNSLVVWSGVVLIALAFVGFLLKSPLTTIPVIGAVVVFGYGWLTHQAETAKTITLLMTISSSIVLLLISVYLIWAAYPVLELMGLGLLTRTADPMWSTSEHVYSLVPMIWGTILTTIMAMTIAGPLGVAGAIFLSEIAPAPVRSVVKPGVEVLAGIPSIVYGFIGYVVINRYMMENLGLPQFGSLLVVGLVVGVMALPTVVSVAEDAINSVPSAMKDGSVAMGVTDWQTVKRITLPAAFSGVTAAVLLGVGRAVGETMAATVILCHKKALPAPLSDVFDCTETLTSVIAAEYGNATGLHMDALFASGVVLFVSVLVLSVGSQYIEVRMSHQLEGDQ
jgi:phosphate transport system permease protein